MQDTNSRRAENIAKAGAHWQDKQRAKLAKAQENQEARASRTGSEQWAKLDRGDHRALKERIKILKRLDDALKAKGKNNAQE